MKSIHVIYRLALLFIFDEIDGTYEVIQLSDDAVENLLVELEKTRQYRVSRCPPLQVIEPPQVLPSQT